MVRYGIHDVSGRAVRKGCLDAGMVLSNSLYKRTETEDCGCVPSPCSSVHLRKAKYREQHYLLSVSPAFCSLFVSPFIFVYLRYLSIYRSIYLFFLLGAAHSTSRLLRGPLYDPARYWRRRVLFIVAAVIYDSCLAHAARQCTS